VIVITLDRNAHTARSNSRCRAFGTFLPVRRGEPFNDKARERHRFQHVSDQGDKVHFGLEVTDDVPPGVVASEKGAWLSTSRTGQTISALVSADLRADLAEGACFNDTPVEVSRA